MADDLKPMLAKVLASGGEKKFFFAYALGKRKDGKGDGELAVNGSKPKKGDVEDQLVGCQEIHEGVCWVGQGPNDSETVYFQGTGKKLAATVIAKMALTAKRVTGRQYDFQLLAEEEGQPTPVAPPAPPAAEKGAAPEAAAFMARAKKLKEAIDQKQKADPARAADLSKLLVKAMVSAKAKDFGAASATLDAVETGLAAPALPANTAMPAFMARAKKLKEALDQKQKADPARAADLSKLLVKAMANAKAKDFGAASVALDAVQAGLAAPTTADGMPAFMARAKNLKAALERLQAADPTRAADLSKLLVKAMTSAKAKDFGAASATLDAVQAGLAAAPQPAKATAGGAPVKFLPTWREARETVDTQLTALQGVLRATTDPDLKRIAEYGMNGITKKLQVGLQVALMDLDATAGDARAGAVAKVRPLLAEYRQFLQGDRIVALLDANPFGVTITLRETLGAALDTIANTLPA